MVVTVYDSLIFLFMQLYYVGVYVAARTFYWVKKCTVPHWWWYWWVSVDPTRCIHTLDSTVVVLKLARQCTEWTSLLKPKNHTDDDDDDDDEDSNVIMIIIMMLHWYVRSMRKCAAMKTRWEWLVLYKHFYASNLHRILSATATTHKTPTYSKCAGKVEGKIEPTVVVRSHFLQPWEYFL